MQMRYIIDVQAKIKYLVDEQAGVYVVLVSESSQDNPNYCAVFYGLCAPFIASPSQHSRRAPKQESSSYLIEMLEKLHEST
jgi:hypothetical protein